MTAPLADQLRALAGQRVLVTGHTGFKGSWLSFWLRRLGAEVHGLALAPDVTPNAFTALDVPRDVTRSQFGDIRNAAFVDAVVKACQPQVVFHLAAQALVRESYRAPVDTIETNVTGTAHLLESIRRSGSRPAVIVVTSDKCYENREWAYGYRESDSLGGHDVYSMSKAATELVVSSFRRSFFPASAITEHGVRLATVRAGNVIGGGDWSVDRIVPDAMRSLAQQEPIRVRNPVAVRPWQHVLEPLSGYLCLAARLLTDPLNRQEELCSAWNFGPIATEARPVRELVDAILVAWGAGKWVDTSDPQSPHEAKVLRLAIDKAVTTLGWSPRWAWDETIRQTVSWYKAFYRPTSVEAMRELTQKQIQEYSDAA